MPDQRQIEIFSAGCPACDDAIRRIKFLACSSCEITILDMRNSGVATRAKSLGIGAVPAVVIDGKLADCCAGGGPRECDLKAAGLGQALE